MTRESAPGCGRSPTKRPLLAGAKTRSLLHWQLTKPRSTRVVALAKRSSTERQRESRPAHNDGGTGTFAKDPSTGRHRAAPFPPS